MNKLSAFLIKARVLDSDLSLDLSCLAVIVCLLKIAIGPVDFPSVLALGLVLVNLNCKKAFRFWQQREDAQLKIMREAALMEKSSEYSWVRDQLKQQQAEIEALQTAAAFRKVGR